MPCFTLCTGEYAYCALNSSAFFGHWPAMPSFSRRLVWAKNCQPVRERGIGTPRSVPFMTADFHELVGMLASAG